MINILIGLVLGLVFFICLSLAFYVGYKIGNKIKKPNDNIQNPVNEKEQLEIQRRWQGFQNLMNYDYNTALGREVKHE